MVMIRERRDFAQSPPVANSEPTDHTIYLLYYMSLHDSISFLSFQDTTLYIIMSFPASPGLFPVLLRAPRRRSASGGLFFGVGGQYCRIFQMRTEMKMRPGVMINS